MFWYWLLGIVGSSMVLSLLLPTTRRIWVFHFYAGKYVLFWLFDVIGVRWIWFKIRGRRYARLTRPVMLRLFAEDMGPTFLKFGQLVASSSGMFPERYVVEFQKCLDRVRPFPTDVVLRTIDSELGERAKDLLEVSTKPLASASIAQVHTAKLADGTDVVVKVQRPGIQQRVAADMKIMRMLAVIVTKVTRDAELANPVGLIEDFSETLHAEIDFRLEAENLERFNSIMSELGHGNICAPVPQLDYTTRRVLVMERFVGDRVDDVEAINARGIDAEATLVDGLRAWFQCVVFYGFFHGDVHAGNLMLLSNGNLGFLDFGIVGRFDASQRLLVTDYMIAFATGNYKRLAEVVVEMGGVPENLDMDAFVADLEVAYKPLLTKSFGEVNFGEMLPDVQRVATRHRMIMPKEFVLITKQMLYFDRYAKLLAPKLNVFTDPRLIMGMMADIQKARSQQQDAG